MNSKLTSVGCIESVHSVFDTCGVLRNAFTACASIEDKSIVTDALMAVAYMAPKDCFRLRGIEVTGGKDGKLWIYDHVIGGPQSPLSEAAVTRRYAIPQPLLDLIHDDHMDYVHATGAENAVSRLRVGDDLTVAWHMDKNLSAQKPQAHRDLSGAGMFVASAMGKDVTIEPKSEHPHGQFFGEESVAELEQDGQIMTRPQAPGERLYFSNLFLHRSHTQWNDNVQSYHMRLLTRALA